MTQPYSELTLYLYELQGEYIIRAKMQKFFNKYATCTELSVLLPQGWRYASLCCVPTTIISPDGQHYYINDCFEYDGQTHTLRLFGESVAIANAMPIDCSLQSTHHTHEFVH